MFVVASVAEFGKHVKRDDTVLEIPCARSSYSKNERTLFFDDIYKSMLNQSNPGKLFRTFQIINIVPDLDQWSIHAYQHKSWLGIQIQHKQQG